VHGDALESQQPPAPPELSLLPSATCVRRRVWLKNAAGFTYGYAVSWWDAEVYRRTMPDPSRPIGASMATAHLDVHREIYATFQCSARRCPKLAERFGVAAESCDCDAAAAAAKEWAERRGGLPTCGAAMMPAEGADGDLTGPAQAVPPSIPVPVCMRCTAWCRYYMMWHAGAPLALICEVFSPAAQGYLGPYAP